LDFMLFACSKIGRTLAFCCAGVCFALGIAPAIGLAAAPRKPKPVAPTAVATAADVSYCFARVRGLDPERLPPAYLVLRLRVSISYLNEGKRAVILPLERERTIYSSLQPGKMREFKQGLGHSDPILKPMDHLPPDVGPASPIDPKNDFFAVIPAGGEMSPPLLEEITMPVEPKGVFRKSPELRGHRVYVKLRFVHRQIGAALQADLSDRWSRFGVPWTGTLTTNTILIDVPSQPEAKPCTDKYIPAHPATGEQDDK
jgi:hypothetical protein